MAEEPQPSKVNPGATQPHETLEDQVTKQPPNNAEARKAAAALASLDDDASISPNNSSNNAAANAEREAAIKNLDAGAGAGAPAATKIKLEPKDVALVQDQLDLSKAKATELLKAHEGSAVAAMKAYIAIR